MAKRVKNVVKFIARDKNKAAAQKAEEQSSTDTVTAERAETVETAGTAGTELPTPPEDSTNHTENNENGRKVLLRLLVDNLSFEFFSERRK